jgi:hypothetical protein
LRPNIDPAFVLSDNAVNDGKAKPSAFTFAFCGEEWFENPWENFFGNAAAGIG